MTDEGKALSSISRAFIEALAANDRVRMEALGREAGAILEKVEGDVFFSADENRSECLKMMDPKLVEATTAATPSLASAAISGLWSSNYKLSDAASLGNATTGARRVVDELVLARALCTALENEAMNDLDSCLTNLASVTSVVPLEALMDRGRLRRDLFSSDVRSSYFRDLPGFPRNIRRESFRRQAQFLRGQLHLAQDAFFAIIEKALKVDKKRHQDAVLAWLSRSLLTKKNEGFLLNLCFVALKLAAPLVEDSDKGQNLLNKVDWSIGSTFGRGFDDEPALLTKDKEVVQNDDDASDSDDDDNSAALLAQALSMSLDPRMAVPPGFRQQQVNPPSFLTEIFWIAHRAAVILQELVLKMHDQAKRLRRAPPSDINKEEQDELLAATSLVFQGGWVTHLEDPRLLTLAANFATQSAKALIRFAATNEKIFAFVPASLLKVACDLWALQLRCRPEDYDARNAAEACCVLMKRTDLITSPVVHAKLVDVVSTMMFSSNDRSVDIYAMNSRRSGRTVALAGAVLDHRHIRCELPVALATLYSQLQAVIGLDVDADAGFDKFTVRHRINDLLLRLWKHPLEEPKTALTDFFANDKNSSNFATACLDNVVYCVEDALDRIRDGKSLEDGLDLSKKDIEIGDLLDSRKRSYYEAQRRSAAAFLNIADSTFELFNQLPLSWTDAAIASRGVAVALTLLQSLLDDDKSLGVEEPKKRWGFDENKFTAYCVHLLTTLEAKAPLSMEAVINDTSFDFQPQKLIARVAPHLRAAGAEEDDDPEEEEEKAMETTRRNLEEALSTLKVAEAEGAYAAAFAEDTLKAVDLVVPSEDEKSIPDYYFSERLASSNATTLKPLQKEIRKLSRDLPCPHVDGAVFVRFDENNLQSARCVVTGPVDTPYYGGLFVFDVFFPNTYPQVPPLVQLMTTGNGMARFNPNLYADGKVCLSLLGTWHATDDSEKWNPSTSSLRQILLSIQTEILIREPWFNEPGREGQRGTKEAKQASDLLNADLRLKTLRYAIIDNLKRPPLGIEDLVNAHFDNIKARILDQCRRDLDQAMLTPRLRAATRRAVDDLLTLLTHDDLPSPPSKKAKQNEQPPSPPTS